MGSHQLDGSDLLIGDAERHACLEQLSEHHALGRLSTEEVQVRIEETLQARTRSDLQAVLIDLPTTASVRRLRKGRHLRDLLGVGAVAVVAQLVMDNAGAPDGPYVLFGAAATGVAGLMLGRRTRQEDTDRPL